MAKMLFCSILLALCFTANSSAASERLLVGAVENNSGEQEFSELLITDGIAELVAEELFKTGRYRLLVRSQEALAQIKKFTTSRGNKASATAPDYDTLATVTIENVKKSRQRSFLGPFSKASVKVTVDIAIRLQQRNGTAQTIRGNGSGKTKSTGVLFQGREGKIHFDRTSAGLATARAVKAAVARLQEEIEK